MAGDRPQGYALLLVLWVLVLLTTLAMAFAANVRTDTRGAVSLAEQVRLRAAADGAIAYAIHRLGAGDRAADGVAGGLVYELPWPDARLTVSMVSESAKIDLNYAPHPLLSGLFRELFPAASAEALADAVLDWRDRDERRAPQGAEAAEYRAAGRTVLPSNRPFQSVAELGLVMGFDSAMLERLRPHLTVYARRPRIDPYSASAAVLAAVPGIDRATAEAFIAYRDAQRTEGAAIRLDSLASGIRYLERRPLLNAVAINATASNDHGRTLARQAVVRLQGRSGRYRLLDWRQTATGAH